MRPACVTFVLLVSLIPAAAQSSKPGIAPAWDVQATLKQLISQVEQYKGVVDKLKIQDWIQKGAPDAYLRQQQVVKTEVSYLDLVSNRLSAQPEKLSLALDALFRLQSLEMLTASLSEGAARYQDRAVGDQLSALLTQNSNTRTQLRQYVMDLSVNKEKEYDIVEREAQRCQATLNRPVTPAPASTVKSSAKQGKK
ncbi:MAG: hypothetical protein IT167_28605 [Bryobacterales bacterium]|nr:hypothetical protein [Bryobacterales bacterium]